MYLYLSDTRGEVAMDGAPELVPSTDHEGILNSDVFQRSVLLVSLWVLFPRPHEWDGQN